MSENELIEVPPALRRFACHFQSIPSDVADLAQQTLLKGLAHIGQFVECRAFSID